MQNRDAYSYRRRSSPAKLGFVKSTDLVDRYEGVDVLSYDTFPKHLAFHKIDLDSGRADLPDAYADFVVAVETIEHLENPLAFMRELVRLCRPGGWVVVTTPNQLSLLSKLTLLTKNQFNAFTATNYPAHITALLEIDLKRIADECGLVEVSTVFRLRGRFPGTARTMSVYDSILNTNAQLVRAELALQPNLAASSDLLSVER